MCLKFVSVPYGIGHISVNYKKLWCTHDHSCFVTCRFYCRFRLTVKYWTTAWWLHGVNLFLVWLNRTVPCLKQQNRTITFYRVVEDCCPGYYKDSEGECRSKYWTSTCVLWAGSIIHNFNDQISYFHCMYCCESHSDSVGHTQSHADMHTHTHTHTPVSYTHLRAHETG